jgi:secondary thiamine-phosphate synthase enzyme
MAIFFDNIMVQSKKEFEIIDITDSVLKCINKSGVKNGLVTLFTQHTTGSLRVGEIEEGLLEDYAKFFENVVPKNRTYKHNTTNVDDRPNAHSHIQSLMLNSNETIPIADGKLLSGTWQKVFFIELDGPRKERKVIVEVMGQ